MKNHSFPYVTDYPWRRLCNPRHDSENLNHGLHNPNEIFFYSSYSDYLCIGRKECFIPNEFIFYYMAKYIKQEMSDLDGSGKQKIFYRIKTSGNINADQFVRELAHQGSGLNEGTVLHVLTAMADKLAYYMGEGYSVTIDGVGTFNPTLGLARNKEIDTLDGDAPKLNARSLVVDGVNFRASKELIRETGRHCDLERGGISRIRRSPYSVQQRLEIARKYLSEHHLMRIADYMRLTGLSRTSATLELKGFRQSPESGITTSGRGGAKVYILSENVSPIDMGGNE